MSRPLKYLTAALLWAAVAGYIIWSAAAAHRQRAAREVTRLVLDAAQIHLADLRADDLQAAAAERCTSTSASGARCCGC